MKSKRRTVIVVERKEDKRILESFLPKPLIRGVEIEVAFGRYGALSSSRTQLACDKNLDALALVLDSESVEKSAIAEERNYLQVALNELAGPLPARAFLAVPAIESLFFASRSLIERLAKRKLSDMEFELAKDNPKKALQIMGGGARVVQTLIDAMTPDDLAAIRDGSSMLKDLTAFLETAIAGGKAGVKVERMQLAQV